VSSCEVSVIIPTRDRWEILSRAALASALAQEDVVHEVIVVDDGSVDRTAERLAALSDPRVRVVRHERSLGVARARNAGLYAARGEWVSFLDDDDLWSPRKLRGQLDAAATADASFVYSSGAAVDAEGRFLFAVSRPDPEGLVQLLLRWNVIWCGCSNVAARTELVRALGGFDERLLQLADWDLWIRLALASRAAATDDVLVAYVMHEHSMLLTDRRDVFPEMDYLVAKHKAESDAYGVRFDQALFTRWVARGHRRAGRRWQAARIYALGARRYRDAGAAVRAAGSLVLPERAIERAPWLAGAGRSSLLEKVETADPAWLDRYRRASSSAQTT
jgi:glycosyltransferase involved in cell wall biosynthesis